MVSIEPEHVADQVYAASKAAFSELIRANSGQTFYAFALFTDDSLQFLHAVANTEEALASTVKRYRETVDPKYGCTSTHAGMRWSYGDWGFFPEVGAEHFEEINEVVRANFDSDENEFEAGIELLWTAILSGFQRLEKERFFGSGPERSKGRCLFYALGAWPLKADVFGGENAKNTVDMTLGNIRLPGRSPGSAHGEADRDQLGLGLLQ